MACVLTSARKYFWHDEVFTRTLIVDPSLTHMLGVMAGGAEAAPPLHHLLARLWLALPGIPNDGELGIRVFSSVGVIVALLTCWTVLRRVYTPRVATVGTLVVFCLSHTILYQNAEARFYGTFLATTALALAATHAASCARRPQPGLLLALVLSHGALVLSHVYGLLYSGAMLGAVVAGDVLSTRGGWRADEVRSGRDRRAVYGAIVAGWSMFLLWLPATIAQADLGRPHSWLPRPTLADLERVYYFALPGSQWWGRVALIGLAIAAAVVAISPTARAARPVTPEDESSNNRLRLLLLAGGFLALPLVAFAVSWSIMPVFFDRYMLPSALGLAILIATAAAWLAVRVRVPKLLYGGLLALLVAYPVIWAVHQPIYPPPGARVAQVAGDTVPVVTENPLEYLPAAHYSGGGGKPYFFALDWAAALDPASALQATVDYKVMRKFRDAGYFAAGIVEGDTILCRYPRFLVVDEPHLGWYERSIARNPEYETRMLGEQYDAATGWVRHKRLILVNRRPGVAPRC